MKNINKQTWLIVGLAALLLLITVLLALFLGTDSQPEPTTVPTEPSTVPVETTLPTETSAPTEPTTQPTEPETEPPTEPATEPPTEPSGNSRPGGGPGSGPSGGNNDQEEEEEEEEEETFPGAGTKENPYTEFLPSLPASFTTVKISTGEEVYYDVYGADGTVLTVNSGSLTVMLGDIPLEPEEGVLTLGLHAEQPDGPVTLALVNTGDQTAFELFFEEPLGGVTNPEPTDRIDTLSAKLEEGDSNGYSYLWTAPDDGELTVTLVSAEPETGKPQIVLTNGEESRSDDAEAAIAVLRGDKVRIQLLFAPDEDGLRPKGTVTVAGTFAPGEGTQANPIEYRGDFPFTTAPIRPQSSLYYSLYGAGGRILTVRDPDVKVTYGDTTYRPNSAGVLILPLGYEEPVQLQIRSFADTEEAYLLEFAYPVGAKESPKKLNDLSSFTAPLAQGNSGGYYFLWTAPEAGSLTVSVDRTEPDNIACTVQLLPEGSDEAVSGTLPVKSGEKILIHVAATPDGQGNYPAVDAVLSGTFTPAPGSEKNPHKLTLTALSGQHSTVPIPGGGAVYYRIRGGAGGMLKIRDADCYVICGGTTYEPENGTVLLPLPSGDTADLCIGNRSQEAKPFDMQFRIFQGTRDNPQQVTTLDVLTADITRLHEGSYFFVYEAREEATLVISTEAVPADAPVYNVLMTTSGMASDVTLWDDAVDGKLRMDVMSGDRITVEVSLDLNDQGKYPEAQITLTGSLEYPEGSEKNPYVLTEGENQALLPEGSEGFWYLWTAEEAGTLTVILDSENPWQYTVSGGETHNSSEDPLQDTVEITLQPGDRFLIWINGYDPATDPLPAVTVTFHVTFVPA